MPYSDRYSNTDWQFEVFKRGKPMDMIFVLCISFISVTYVVGTHWNCLIEAIPMCTHKMCPFNNLLFFIINRFSLTFQLLFMFQCNEHVEINKFLCSLACTWMIILDSQFYIIDSLSLDVSLE